DQDAVVSSGRIGGRTLPRAVGVLRPVVYIHRGWSRDLGQEVEIVTRWITAVHVPAVSPIRKVAQVDRDDALRSRRQDHRKVIRCSGDAATFLVEGEGVSVGAPFEIPSSQRGATRLSLGWS